MPANTHDGWFAWCQANDHSDKWWKNTFINGPPGRYAGVDNGALFCNAGMTPYLSPDIGTRLQPLTVAISGIEISYDPQYWLSPAYGALTDIQPITLPESVTMAPNDPGEVARPNNALFSSITVTGNRVTLGIEYWLLSRGAKIYRTTWTTQTIPNPNPNWELLDELPFIEIVAFGAWELVATTRRTKFIDQGLATSERYAYKIVGFDESGDCNNQYQHPIEDNYGAPSGTVIDWYRYLAFAVTGGQEAAPLLPQSPEHTSTRGNFAAPLLSHAFLSRFGAVGHKTVQIATISAKYEGNPVTGFVELKEGALFDYYGRLWGGLSIVASITLNPEVQGAGFTRILFQDNGPSSGALEDPSKKNLFTEWGMAGWSHGFPGKNGTLTVSSPTNGLIPKGDVFIAPRMDGTYPLGVI
jgi:hypothetical protein